MRKKRIRQNAAGERVAGAQIERSDGEGGVRAEQLAVSAPDYGLEATPTTNPMPRSHRELGEAILASGNPVKVGCELLDKDKSEDRGAPTRLRSLETFAGWAFGKPDAQGHRKPPRIIWDIPGPPYEPVDPEQEKLEGGEK